MNKLDSNLSTKFEVQNFSRLVLLCSELRQNKYPNAVKFVEIINRKAESDNGYLSISEKTFHRDINELKNDFDAPIVYNYQEKGFELTNSAWEFQIPWIDEPELIDVALASKIANDILPTPLQNRLSALRDQVFARHSTSFFESSILSSFIISWGYQKTVSKEIFENLFEAWQKRSIIEIVYSKGVEENISYTLEPHVLTFHQNTWYLVAKKLPNFERRTFVLQRINKVSILSKRFSNDMEFIKEVKKNGPYYQPDLKNTRVEYTKNSIIWAKENYPPNQIELLSSGNLLVTIPEIHSYDLVNHILSFRGEVIAHDQSITQEIKEIAQRFLS